MYYIKSNLAMCEHFPLVFLYTLTVQIGKQFTNAIFPIDMKAMFSFWTKSCCW